MPFYLFFLQGGVNMAALAQVSQSEELVPV